MALQQASEPASLLPTPPPPDYKCSECQVHGPKMWRQTHVFACCVDLLCASCALISERCPGPVDAKGMRVLWRFQDPETGEEMCQRTDQIGSLVPAVPVPDTSRKTFWGYTSIPPADCAWWDALPTDAVLNQ